MAAVLIPAWTLFVTRVVTFMPASIIATVADAVMATLCVPVALLPLPPFLSASHGIPIDAAGVGGRLVVTVSPPVRPLSLLVLVLLLQMRRWVVVAVRTIEAQQAPPAATIDVVNAAVGARRCNAVGGGGGNFLHRDEPPWHPPGEEGVQAVDVVLFVHAVVGLGVRSVLMLLLDHGQRAKLQSFLRINN